MALASRAGAVIQRMQRLAREPEVGIVPGSIAFATFAGTADAAKPELAALGDAYEWQITPAR